MKRTVLIILSAVLMFSTFGCSGVYPTGTGKYQAEETTNEVTTEEITTEAITEDPDAVYKQKVHERIAKDGKNFLNNKGISPGNMFFMSYSEAISRFVKLTGITYFSCEKALERGFLSDAELKNMLKQIGSLTSDNINICVIAGRVMQNPDIPYLITDEEIVLRFALIYDNDAELHAQGVLEENENLYTCVTIAVSSF